VPTLSAIFCWLRTNEQSLAIWLEGLALVAIFGLELKEYKRQGREAIKRDEESTAQMAIAKDTADATRINAEAMVSSERAWVLVDIGRLPPFDPDPNRLEFLWIFPTIRNYGRTVARIKRIVGIVKLIPEGQELPSVPEYTVGQGFDQGIDAVLPPQAPMQPRLGVSGDEWIEVRQGRRILFVHGFIEYFDGISDKQRKTAYCFAYAIQRGFSPAESGFYPYLAAPAVYTDCT
jgi:hypothetical protein